MMDDKSYLKLAYVHAMSFSTDPSTQNGAVLVDDAGDIVSYGANHFPKGVVEITSRWERPAKYSWVEHAERNVIYSAAYNGVKTNGLTMYCPWAACADCGRAIIQAGIKKIVVHKNCADRRGAWDASINIALKMFEEAGVKYEIFDGVIGDVKIRFNGEIISV